jgi:hypothetical protein
MDLRNLISRKDEMKRIVVVVSLCLLSTACFGQEEYRNKKWHFSFMVPDGWEIISDELVLDDYTKNMKIRFDDAAILSLCRQSDKSNKSSILVQAELLGEEKRGLVYESFLKDDLRSNANREASRSYLEDAENKWIEQGEVAKGAKPKGQIYYDSAKNIFYETTALPRIRGGAIGAATVRVLGHNRVTILSLELFGRNCDELLNFIEEAAGSFAYDKNYGFGEAPATTIFKTLWFWLFPGFGALIVMFLIYRWVASEYG